MTMEDAPSFRDSFAASHRSPDTNTAGRNRSGSGGSITSRFPFFRTSGSRSSLDDQESIGASTRSDNASPKQQRALAAAISQQHKTRRRKGSLRKVVLLGRGVAREKRDQKLPLPLPQEQPQLPEPPIPLHPTNTSQNSRRPSPVTSKTQQTPYIGPDVATSGTTIRPSVGLGLGLGLSDDTPPRPSIESLAPNGTTTTTTKPTGALNHNSPLSSPAISYTSTTDEEDAFTGSLPVPSLGLRSGRASPSPSSGSESYFCGPTLGAQSPARSAHRRQLSNKQQYTKSPLSLQGLAAGTPTLATMDSGYHDYSETEWWGWVVLVVTWLVFIIGMGSCLNIWSWAWDVGTTPYAPPELEDDPTLPIVGYYPALMILTSIMAWVWVIVAWVGMKYFRHAKISGD
ncbi:hypothetical protein GGR50DRAFT_394540 [Xylaria sp. CBS 124048]|nr:hypothetical protein GGR50DRAFT_394540 [Xylaria sp. CBS 124048]